MALLQVLHWVLQSQKLRHFCVVCIKTGLYWILVSVFRDVTLKLQLWNTCIHQHSKISLGSVPGVAREAKVQTRGRSRSSVDNRRCVPNVLSCSCVYMCRRKTSASPWYNCTGWLGLKHQVTYLPLLRGVQVGCNRHRYIAVRPLVCRRENRAAVSINFAERIWS